MDSPLDSTPARPRRHLGIRGKVVLILLATLAVALTVNSLLALHAQRRDILEETDRRGHEAAHFISHYLAYSVVGYDYHTLELLLRDLVQGGDIVYARIENARGNLMAEAGTPPAAGHAQEYREDIRLNGDTLGRLTLSLSTDHIVATLEARTHDVLLQQLAAILAVLLAGFAALSVLIIRPLTVMSRVIRSNLNAESPGLERFPPVSHDEFGDLARGFNALQDRLDDARQRLEARVDLANLELKEANARLAAQAAALQHANRELQQLSVTDPLTGLYNRRYFEKLMESEVEHSIHKDETISILLLDIDLFREFNERYGHHGGDRILREVAQRIAATLRPTDVACRYGGDEFFILCRHATIASALTFADDLQRTLAEPPLQVEGEALRVDVSIGVATIPGVHRVTNAEQFFHCADAALRAARQGGRGVVHYSMLERAVHAGAV